jgi:hypothetical protein
VEFKIDWSSISATAAVSTGDVASVLADYLEVVSIDSSAIGT